MVIPPEKPIKEANKSNLNHGVIQYDLFWPFEIIGDVRFRFIVGKNRGKLIIWMPKSFSINMTKEQLYNYENIIYSYCQQCANWFMKRYCCRLEPVGLHQKPHFSILDTIESRVLNDFGNFSSARGSIWVDCSTGVPEWETDKLEYAILKMEMPEIIYSVMDENMQLKNIINNLEKRSENGNKSSQNHRY